MLTIEKLKNYGANTESGIKRCANNEALYLRLVGTIPSNNSFNNLYEAITLQSKKLIACTFNTIKLNIIKINKYLFFILNFTTFF